MAGIDITNSRKDFIHTYRKDSWWVSPLVTFLCFTAFVIYVTWAVFQGDNYTYGPYLSPLYSPELFGNTSHSWFGPKPDWWPVILPWSPAILILWAPGLFRLTCYYYRGAYYKAFWADPVACTVTEPRKTYRGENSLPLIIQNIHRYFLYIALIFLFILASDVWKALWFTDNSTGEKSFGVGAGTLVLLINLIFLGGYTLGCHSLRHAIGGIRNRLSGAPVRYKAYMCVSCFNRKHLLWAWMSLFWVAFSDIYIRLCALGVWSDWRII